MRPLGLLRHSVQSCWFASRSGLIKKVSGGGLGKVLCRVKLVRQAAQMPLASDTVLWPLPGPGLQGASVPGEGPTGAVGGAGSSF